ncbi:hypothetical protein MN608_04247 [Microdochium nivale]|nr:hypothetical protein MN608_04247 [Microdochium nivale]
MCGPRMTTKRPRLRLGTPDLGARCGTSDVPHISPPLRPPLQQVGHVVARRARCLPPIRYQTPSYSWRSALSELPKHATLPRQYCSLTTIALALAQAGMWIFGGPVRTRIQTTAQVMLSCRPCFMVNHSLISFESPRSGQGLAVEILASSHPHSKAD